MPRLSLYAFRYRNEVTGKWMKARYVAEKHEIAVRHAQWESPGRPRSATSNWKATQALLR
jgi:hypothetical protein